MGPSPSRGCWRTYETVRRELDHSGHGVARRCKFNLPTRSSGPGGRAQRAVLPSYAVWIRLQDDRRRRAPSGRCGSWRPSSSPAACAAEALSRSVAMRSIAAAPPALAAGRRGRSCGRRRGPPRSVSGSSLARRADRGHRTSRPTRPSRTVERPGRRSSRESRSRRPRWRRRRCSSPWQALAGTGERDRQHQGDERDEVRWTRGSTWHGRGPSIECDAVDCYRLRARKAITSSRRKRRSPRLHTR